MRLYEDFTVGDVYRSAIGRTVTETDNLLFTMLSLNTNELHFNEEAAKATEWGRILVNSTFTLALVLGLSVADTSQAGAVNLGWTEIRLPHPVFVGDTIWSETEVTSARGSASRLTHGIVGVRTRGINQRREVVCEFARSFLVPKRAAAVDAFPASDEPWRVS
jgi:itaconyl-CoA hydratase